MVKSIPALSTQSGGRFGPTVEKLFEGRLGTERMCANSPAQGGRLWKKESGPKSPSQTAGPRAVIFLKMPSPASSPNVRPCQPALARCGCATFLNDSQTVLAAHLSVVHTLPFMVWGLTLQT